MFDGIVNLPVFLAAALALCAAPGPDSAYILGRTLLQGRRAGVVSVLGIVTGAAMHVLAAGLGLSAFLAASASAFGAVKLAGAAYLVWLGVKTFRERPAGAQGVALPRRTDRQLFVQGVLTDVLNPKVAVFFLAFLPHFIAPDAPHKVASFLLLGGMVLAMGLVWDLGLALAAAQLTRALRRRPSFGRWSNRAMGVLLAVLGVGLAAEEL